LLHEALRQLLGDHITQKGSMVASDRLRFDISHPKAITTEELRTLERAVNGRIRANLDVSTRLMTPDEAIEEGAMALFGEKYGDEVRVVTMGNGSDRYSVELCGGTHVRRTGDIGAFKIITEGALASGVRRIEALAGAAAEHHFASQEALLRQSAEELKTAPQDVPGRIAALLDDRKRLERELADMRRKLATGGGVGSSGGDDLAKEIAGIKFAGRKLDGVPAKELKPMADDLKQQIGSGIVAIISVDSGKASLVVGVTDDLTDRFDAVSLVRAGSAALGGKGGGGRPDMAQAGGPDGDAAEAALKSIEDVISGQV
jgi:alanyl-tRNA synthetase